MIVRRRRREFLRDQRFDAIARAGVRDQTAIEGEERCIVRLSDGDGIRIRHLLMPEETANCCVHFRDPEQNVNVGVVLVRGKTAQHVQYLARTLANIDDCWVQGQTDETEFRQQTGRPRWNARPVEPTHNDAVKLMVWPSESEESVRVEKEATTLRRCHLRPALSESSKPE
jgi:hypothetical protein